MGSNKPATIAILLGFLLFLDPHGTLAASGGRMGGRAFSSASRHFRPPRIRHYHNPPPRGQVELNAICGREEFDASRQGEEFNSSCRVEFDVLPGYCVPIVVAVLAVLAVVGFLDWRDERKTSVIKLQVGLFGLPQPFQKELDQIAKAADTSTLKSLSYILKETTSALLRHQECCISAYSSVDVKGCKQDGEKHFNDLSIEERDKFDEETLVNFDSIKIQKTTKLAFQGFKNEYIVVTILVAADGVHGQLEINSSADLREALQKLASIPPSKTRAVEVLWTPQRENDTLSKQEYLEDYPLLRPL